MKSFSIPAKIKPEFLKAIEDHGDFFAVRLQGHLDTFALEKGNEQMTQVSEKVNLYSKPILCDFEDVSDSDTATLAGLIKRLSDFRKQGSGKVVFANVKGDLKSLFEITHLTELFVICDTEEEAVSTLLAMIKK